MSENNQANDALERFRDSFLALSQLEGSLRSPSDEAILDIWKDVIESEHGSFLKHFARALVSADRDNFELLRIPALGLMIKYGLGEEGK